MFWTMGGLIGVSGLIQLLAIPKINNDKKSCGTSSLQIMKIPGNIILFLHCFGYKVIGSSKASGVSNFLNSSGYIYSLMISAWCMSILAHLFSGPSPLLDFIFHGHKYLELPVALLSFANCFEPGIYIPPFQAAINLAVVNGHEKDSIQTYGMVTGLLNGGLGLGAMVGPIMSGAVTDATDFTWTLTVLSGIGLAMLIIMSAYLIWMKMTGQPLKLV
ncbi:SLC18B1 [Bugula neritina]|uniref:SLC18B1 n=1 Tax=Bugula neritina TaxID=10212 RepID=A0A7J7J7W7_BUGNE|nr:SLC18B1 [Bugula neritina]